MMVDEPPSWTLPQHLGEGRKAIVAIAAIACQGPQAICHHFAPAEGVDIDRLLMEHGYAKFLYGPLEPLFRTEGLEFLFDRREAWEKRAPTLGWLEGRVPMMVELAADHRLIYEGWTWEPSGMQPIGACTFNVINNR